MRPVRLDITGFAAFRDATTVDFTDADYFALTGPTGSGKSTVIDAMTFALYGSAPRWGRENAIQYALAPTANRCAVRLVFDVAGQRYVAAREVRRSGKSITQKNARLERYLDPAATGDAEADEPTESLAADPRAVRAQVAELLGLDFEDFCTCVVLPQGDFATFLRASVGERQTILLKLLGARHYESIARMANRRAADANARIDALQGQLTGYADATEDTEAAARAREVELQTLHTRIGADVDALGDTLARRTAAATRRADLTGQLTLLAAVRTPAHIDDLQQNLATADEAYRISSAAERAAGDALQRAEEALQAGPQREPLQETLRWHAERVREAARLPAVEAATQHAGAALVEAQQSADQAETELAQHRDDHERRRTARDRADDLHRQLSGKVDQLRDLVAPDGVADLDRAAAEAHRDRERAEQAVEQAEISVRQRETAVGGLPEWSALVARQRSIEAFTEVLAQRAELLTQQRVLVERLSAAEDELGRSRTDRDRARSELEELRTRSAAADLRPHLELGHSCPVCDHTVATLPPPIVLPALDDARAAVATTEEAHRTSEVAAAELRTRAAALTLRVESAAERIAELDRALLIELPDHPAGADRRPDLDRAATAELITALDAALTAQGTARQGLASARAAVRAATTSETRITAESAQAWATLHATHGQLTGLGAPPVTASRLAEAWTALLDWSFAEAARIDADELTSARAALTASETDLADAVRRLREATVAARTAGEQLTAAAVTDGQARSEQTDLVRRLDALETELADRPGENQARQLLDEHQRLDRDATAARADAQAAARERHRAEAERDRRREEREAAGATLRRVREPLIGLDPPDLDGADLGSAWAELTGWAEAQTASRRADLTGLEADLAHLDRDAETRLATIQGLLQSHELDIAVPSLNDLVGAGTPARLTRIPTDIELALERARAASAEIARRRRQADALRSSIAADVEIEQVSRQLALMMSAKRFPQWLADAALDTLVADASASLLQLSNGQFELTHERGEFYVIDHADADSARSVKTLSGGETFQASLALALALSEQLSTLGAGGRTTLDSIFLDEGFGTLDPDALEIVASTLENLSQGNRMVGVVTHVAALAERVPIRFEVTRDSRTSSVERVGA